MKRFNCPDCNDYIQSCEECIRYVNSDKYISNDIAKAITLEEWEERLKKIRDSTISTETIRLVPMQPSNAYYNESCRYCSNNPINGGSGICQCILGQPKIT